MIGSPPVAEHQVVIDESTPRRMWALISYWLPVVLTGGVILWATLRPPLAIPLLFPFQDKVGHFLGFAAFGFFLKRALTVRSAARQRSLSFYGIGIVATLAVATETLQLVVPKRSFELLDLAADILGGVIGVWIAVVAVSGRKRRRNGTEGE